MTERRTMTVDGNEAAASVAHRVSDVIAIYPLITLPQPEVTTGDKASPAAPEGEE
jgi:pyruvate/2-oxoacid:ferredoxin oxidoreductase alpha subunit